MHRNSLNQLHCVRSAVAFALISATVASNVKAAGATTNDNGSLEEVVVTAQKRDEKILDVPAPVTVINTAALVSTNQVRFEDYYSSIPNLAISPGVQSQTILSIRGVSPGGVGGATVAVIVDDAPYSSVNLTGGGNILPDFDPGDLARVEILRGPQGTLYGSSGMGGLIKFVTVDPTTSALSGQLQATGSSVSNGDGLGFSVRGSVNVPLSDDVAFRASAYHRIDPGYIDNVFTHLDGVNRTQVDGGHFSALWRPSEDWSVKLSALIQRSTADGSSDIAVPTPTYPQTVGLGDLQQINVAGTGAFYRNFQAYSGTVNGKIGQAQLTSVTSYNMLRMHDSFDLTAAIGGFANFLFPAFCQPFAPQTCGTPVLNEIDTKKFSQELRLTAALGSHVDWLLGAFYTEEKQLFVQTVTATNPYTGEVGGLLLGSNPPQQPAYEELAAFTDVTVHFGTRFQIQFGGRESHIVEPSVSSGELFGPLNGAPPDGSLPPTYSPSYRATHFSYLVTPELRLSPDVMLYARAASGYRPGGANCAGTCTGVATGNPSTYTPDTTEDYDLGLKADLAGHTLSVDAALYYIAWKNIQLTSTNANQGSFIGNGGEAKSDGIELSSQWRPLQALRLSAWMVFSEAELTKDLPSTSGSYGLDGDRLPFSARFSGNASIDYDFNLGSGYTATVGGTEAYIGQTLGNFQAPQSGRPVYSPYAKTDLRVELRKGDWKVDLSALNVTDRRAKISGGDGGSYAYYIIPPRTVSISFSRSL